VKDVPTNGNLVKKIIRELVLNVSLLIGISQDKIKLGRRKMGSKQKSRKPRFEFKLREIKK